MVTRFLCIFDIQHKKSNIIKIHVIEKNSKDSTNNLLIMGKESEQQGNERQADTSLPNRKSVH